jgi:acetoin utilization deacetylase AcuC-like enzyme
MSLPLFYSSRFICQGYGVDTREKAAEIAQSLIDSPIEGVEIIDPTDVTKEVLLRVHQTKYVNAMLSGVPASVAIGNGMGEWSPELRDSVLATTGGAVDSAVYSYENSRHSGALTSGLHHAKYSHGSGFCTFNGLVIAAKEVLAMGAQRVLILDLDAHCGGGTASLINGVVGIEQVDVSVNSYDQYSGIPNAHLVMSRGTTYLADIATALSGIDTTTPIDLMIYNAGMDPHEDCSIGGEQGITSDVIQLREAMVYEWARLHNVPISFVLAGGYSGRKLTKTSSQICTD